MQTEVEQAAIKHYEEIAIEWFGKPEPPRHVVINVTLIDDRKDIRGFYSNGTINLVEQRHDVADNYLRHELTHFIFHNRFGNQAAWIKEGTACLYNKPPLIDVAKQFATQGDIPRLINVLNVQTMDREDRRMYAAATTFVEYLIQHHSKEYFIRFCEQPNITKFYGPISDLEHNWKQYIIERYK